MAEARKPGVPAIAPSRPAPPRGRRPLPSRPQTAAPKPPGRWRTAAAPIGRLHDRWRTSRPLIRWGSLAGVIVLAVVAFFVFFFQWNWFRGPLAGVIGGRLHRPVQITGDLEVHPWSLTPRATVNGLVIGNPAWAGREPMTEIPRLTVSVQLLRLLRAQVVLPLVEADRPRVRLVRDAQGRANWMFGDPRQAPKPLNLPAIRHFIIEGGSLTINDAQRHLTFEGTVSSNERMTGAQRGVFVLEGKGLLNRAPFLARVTGGPLLNVAPDKPYPFNAHVAAGATVIDARGVIPKPFDLGLINAALALRGPDLSDLYLLTGLVLPNTPPYSVSGQFSRNGRVFRYDNFSGRVGDSDLSGDLSVQTGRERPLLTADIASRRLDFDDLAAIFGGPPSTAPGETASPEQRAMDARLAAENRMLPAASLNIDRLRKMDANVHYRAASITSPMPVRALDVTVKVDNGLLTASPLTLSLTQGTLSGSVSLNGRQAVPTQAIDLRLTNARLQDFVGGGANAPLSGGLFARARLTSSGDSVRIAAANANGVVSVVVPRGHVRKAFAELLGINATRGLFLLLTNDHSETDVRCAVADFSASNGILTSRRIVFDTDVVLAQGAGTVNLRTERLNLRLEGKAKSFRLVRIMAPITLKGSLRSPDIGVDGGKIAQQLTLSGILATLASPLAAILPFVDAGLAEDADCSGLVAAERARGAPSPRR